jgi:hypothetical protein
MIDGKNEPLTLPAGYRILNDGPGREVLVQEQWEECPVFPTTEEAVAYARYLEGLS